MNNLPPQSPLSDQLRDRIGKRHVRVAVFFTFQFDPAFFETEVLQTLFDHDWSRNRRVALAQAEDVLRKVEHLAVYYDLRGIPETASSASLDYRRFALSRPGGVFHPKNILLLLEDEDESQKSTSLLLVTTSANLTRAGWWENLEAAHMIELPESSKSLLRDDLLGDNGLLSRVVQHDKTSDEHRAVEEIRKFLRYRTEPSGQRSQNGVLRPRIYAGQKPLANYLLEDVQIDTTDFNLEIISPYFDNTDDAKAVVTLIEALNPRATRIFLPKSDVGVVLCRKEYYEAVAGIPRVSWGLLPRNFTRYSKTREDSVDRFVHAKVYRLFSPRRNQEYLLVGSVNLTQAAHSAASSGNLESAILFQPTPARNRLDWWLSPVEDSYQPGAFEDSAMDDSAPLACHSVSFRYDWQNNVLSYYWVLNGSSPGPAQVRHRSVAPFVIEDIKFDHWVDLPTDVASRLREGLRSCSFLDVIAGSKPPQRVLVREEGMENKPSLSVSLTPEEILEYWSLFSPEQKSAFLSRKLESLVFPVDDHAADNGPVNVHPQCLEQRSMFDRFAGIFHAFSCVENLIAEALTTGNKREARCLLFGSKYDSLKTLIERITVADNADRVNRYITLLCALQLLGTLPGHDAEFAAHERKALEGIRDMLKKAIQTSRQELLPELGERPGDFVDWFEKMFFLDIPAPEVEDQPAKPIERIDLDTAEELVNFSGRSGNTFSFAKQQLEGAVALHNLLAAEGFAYIADEVGMGKTYVALGTIALLRHFNPELRVLYIVPKENLQRKWQKEARNFATKNWLAVDHRVKTFQDTPARQLVSCSNLLDLIRETAVNANRDFLVRMTSFSLPLAGQSAKWAELRDKVISQLPWLPPHLFDLRNKWAFKDAFARAVNAVIPTFDLLVIDEAHNLKHGFGLDVSSRNRLLGLTLGHPDDEAPMINGGMVKVDRVLALSATPIETTFRELWNQMDVLCLGHLAPDLANEDLDDLEKKRIAARYLIRRVADLKINGSPHTKNMYRREWRAGGVSAHDNPLEVADTAQRLIVALIQKKVAEVLQKTGRKVDGHFTRSFQIGMLSSFESFLQTAKVKSAESEDEATFDQDELARNAAEKDGIDTPSIEKIGRTYEQRFGAPMPHPKMDAVARQLWNWVRRGEKSLVFVRRIASVKELRDKVAHEYDRWLLGYLKSGLSGAAGVLSDLEYAFDEYTAARSRREMAPKDAQNATQAGSGDIDGDLPPVDDDTGGLDNFFAWFFRGEGPPGIVSGASFRKFRLGSEGAALATLFEDNYVGFVLGETAGLGAVLAGWQAACPTVSTALLRELAYRIFRRSKQKKFPRRRVYLAYQEAALRTLAENNDEIGRRARIIIDERFETPFPETAPPAPESFPEPGESLDSRTFFTELVLRPSFASAIWPTSAETDFRAAFRNREQRRELLTSAMTLGHPIVDLWLLAVRRLPSLRRGLGERGEDTPESLAEAFLDLLSDQRDQEGMSSWRELEAIGQNFELILNVNFPDLQSRPLQDLPGYYRAAMQRQTPVGGMWGTFNQQMVSQFRMPGYPYVLVTTNVVQEGEDLHTFCSRVVHYGITWTPSAMEQRTGRVDRIGSQAHRRLDGAHGVTHDDFLQVFFPYLADTVEIVQVQEVFRRMNRFLDLMHEAVQKTEADSSLIDLTQRIVSTMAVVPPNRVPLRSSFAIDSQLLEGGERRPAIPEQASPKETIDLFNRFLDGLSSTWAIEWVGRRSDISRSGVAHLAAGSVLRAQVSSGGTRRQAFHVTLRTSAIGGHVLLRCSSPVGKIARDDDPTIAEVLWAHQRLGRAKLCALVDEEDDTLALHAERHILFAPETTHAAEVEHAVFSAVTCADELERCIFQTDQIQADLLPEDTGGWNEEV